MKMEKMIKSDIVFLKKKIEQKLIKCKVWIKDHLRK